MEFLENHANYEMANKKMVNFIIYDITFIVLDFFIFLPFFTTFNLAKFHFTESLCTSGVYHQHKY